MQIKYKLVIWFKFSSPRSTTYSRIADCWPGYGVASFETWSSFSAFFLQLALIMFLPVSRLLFWKLVKEGVLFHVLDLTKYKERKVIDENSNTLQRFFIKYQISWAKCRNHNSAKLFCGKNEKIRMRFWQYLNHDMCPLQQLGYFFNIDILSLIR